MGANFFFVGWNSATARQNDATGGCIFVCTGGTCKVGQDGLPVELLEFSVAAEIETDDKETVSEK